MTEAAESTASFCFKHQDRFGGPQEAATAIIAAALFVGYLKGRFVLSKTVKRVVDGIARLSLPIHFYQVYSKKYLLLIGSMIALGVLLKFLPIFVEVRGFVDVAVGTALIQGSLHYFKSAKALKVYL